MSQIIRHLLIELQKHKGWLQAIAAIVTIVGFPKLIPQKWWGHWLLSWSISSQLLLPPIIAILIFGYIVVSKYITLNNQLKKLREKIRISNLSPEEQADISKIRISNSLRFISRFFSETNKKP